MTVKLIRSHQLTWWLPLPSAYQYHRYDAATFEKLNPLITICQWLSAKITKVLISWDVSTSPLIPGCSLSHKIISNRIALFLEYRVRQSGVCYNHIVITIGETGTYNRYTHHSEFVSESPNILSGSFHCHEFTAKSRSLIKRLFL